MSSSNPAKVGPVDLAVDGQWVRLAVRVSPRAPATTIRGVRDGILELAVAAPPVDGAANDEVVRFIARDLLRIPRTQVRIVHGERGRRKTVAILGMDVETLRTLLAAVIP